MLIINTGTRKEPENRKGQVMREMIIGGFWMSMLLIAAMTAFIIGERNHEYNRYEFHAVANNDMVYGYRMDKRTGEIVLLSGKTIILTEWLDPYAEFSRPDKTKR